MKNVGHKIGYVLMSSMVLCLIATVAMAATARWEDIDFAVTEEDGLVISGAHYDGSAFIGAASLPYFTFNGKRYALHQGEKTAGPTLLEGEGFLQISARYEVPVSEGMVAATVSWNFLDADPQSPEQGQFSAWVDFSGPEGDYSFFWRIDPDLGGNGNDRVEVFRSDKGDRLFRSVLQEMTWGLSGSKYLNRYQARIVDGVGTRALKHLYISAQPEDNARLHVVAYHPGETQELPQNLINGEAIARFERGDVQGIARAGSDVVFWYETRLSQSTGAMTGVDTYALSAARSNATIEQDHMTGTEWVPASAEIQGQTQSIASAFASGGININVRNSSTIGRDAASSNAELHSYMVSNKDFEGGDSSSNWYSYLLVANLSTSGPATLGIMFDDGATDTDGKPRQGCAIFYDAHTSMSDPGAEMLLSATHEQGHCYNQHHEDYCPSKRARATFKSYGAIMSYSFTNTVNWVFGWNSVNSMQGDPEEFVRPGHGKSFTSLGSYNMTPAHSKGHANLGCFIRSMCCR